MTAHSLRPQRTGGGISNRVLIQGMGLATTGGEGGRLDGAALVPVGKLSMMIAGWEFSSKMALIGSDPAGAGLPAVGMNGRELK